MGIPAPLIIGTILFAILGAILLIGVFGSLVTGSLSKDNAA